MPHKIPVFSFMPTGIGSVPFQDTQETCKRILNSIKGMPFWPQLVKRSSLEDMNIQFSEGLPLLKIDQGKRSLVVSNFENMESELVSFYDRFLSGDTEFFAISEEYAPGLYEIMRLIEQQGDVQTHYVKGQSVGPVTFAAGITGPEGKTVLHHEELLEAMTRGLAIKALWQVRQLGKHGHKPVIFLDEPYLSGFGSAFSPIQRHQVVEILQTVIQYLRDNADPLIGIHCCGNTDWSMLLEAGPDIINFDAFGYMDYFLLYKEDIIGFLERGGIIAWGIVPTSEFSGEETVTSLVEKLREGMESVYAWGIDPDLLAERSLLTPSCGMGTMSTEAADQCLDLLSQVSRTMVR